MKTQIRTTRALALAGALVAALVAAPVDAAAQNKAECTFIEIEATNGPGGIDKKLSALAKKLARPPFSSWKSFKVMGRYIKTLELNKAQDISLKLGGKLSALLRELAKAAGSKGRWFISVTTEFKGGKRVIDTKINAAPGD